MNGLTHSSIQQPEELVLIISFSRMHLMKDFTLDIYPLKLIVPLVFIWIYNASSNTFGNENDFTKYLKASYL